MKVLVLSMVPQRDWPIDQMICREIEELGHDAMVRDYLRAGRDAIIVERPDVVVLPVVRNEYTRDFGEWLKEWGVYVVARRSEPGVSRAQYDKMPRHLQINQIGRYEYNHCIDMELVWGKEFADILVEEGMVTAKKVRLIGGITLDPYFAPDVVERIKRGAGKQKREDFLRDLGLDPDKKTMVWACGFVTADLDGEYVLPEAKPGEPIHREIFNKHRLGRTKWIEAINYLYERHRAEWNFIIRPHPKEELTEYKQKLDKSVAVSNSGGAGTVLVNADMVIHAGGTMAVEAHLLGIPAFNYFDQSEEQLVREVSPRYWTPEELNAAVCVVELGKSNALITSVADLEEHVFGVIDGQAHKRVAEAVDEFRVQPQVDLTIPSRWPSKERRDYETEGVKRCPPGRQVPCHVCSKYAILTTDARRIRCPNCGIAFTLNLAAVAEGPGPLEYCRDMGSIYEAAHRNNALYRTTNQGVRTLSYWAEKIKPKSRILDFGCGNGKLCEWLVREGHSVVGTDIADGGYERRGYEFLKHDATVEVLYWPDKEFDYCLAFDVLEHIRERELEAVVLEIVRVSREQIFSISNMGVGPASMHVTVRPAEWWEKRLSEIAPDVEWAITAKFTRNEDDPVCLIMGKPKVPAPVGA